MEIDTSCPEPVQKIILDAGKTDGESLKISKVQNEKRAKSRERIKKAGMNTTAYGMGVKVAKLMLTQGERIEFIKDFLVTVDVLTKVQMEFFPDLAMIAERKRARAAARAAKEGKKEGADHTAPDNPRGDPAKGGAGGKVSGRGKARDAAAKPVRKGAARGTPETAADRAAATSERTAKLADIAAQSPGATADVQAQEQEEGGVLLDAAVERMKGGVDIVSQSDVIAEDIPLVEEDGDAMIRRVAAQKNAERVAREAGVGMEPIDASGDDGVVDNHGVVGGKQGLGSIADERPLSQSEVAAQKRHAAGLN